MGRSGEGETATHGDTVGFPELLDAPCSCYSLGLPTRLGCSNRRRVMNSRPVWLFETVANQHFAFSTQRLPANPFFPGDAWGFAHISCVQEPLHLLDGLAQKLFRLVGFLELLVSH